MVRYDKSALIRQRNKYYEAITKINNSMLKVGLIKQQLDDKSKYDGITGIDNAKIKVESTISELANTKAKLNSTIDILTTEINRPDEEIEKEELGGEV